MCTQIAFLKNNKKGCITPKNVVLIKNISEIEYVPNLGEKVIIKNITYKTVDVITNYDNEGIDVILEEL